MMQLKNSLRRFGLAQALIAAQVLSFPCSALLAQNTAKEEQEPVFELSPFEVAVSNDRGYFASNAITGTRVNVPIQDIPLNIEVVTNEFIEDTGATDLRSSLQYSAGILLTTQNDALNQASFSDIGNVNNPEGVTNNKTNTSFKVRGFVTDNVLREGFRRQHATDSINIERVEVVRGPSALLYGIGNFGGIVNYVAKEPTSEPQQEVTFSLGSDSLYRSTIDSSGPLTDTWDAGYRVTAAYEQSQDWTDLKESSHWFISPVFTFKPFEKTKIKLDFEYGRAEDDGVGFQSVRTPSIEIPVDQTDRMETYGFLQFEGKDVRTYRWSGPDTALNTESYNALVEVQQEIFEGFNIQAGYNRSGAFFDVRDVFGGLVVNTGPEELRDTIRARQVIDGQDTDVYTEVENVILQYNWSLSEEDNVRDQARVEANYQLELMEDRKWLRMQHNILAGYSYELADKETTKWVSDDWNWKSPTDSSYIRYDVQGDGSPSNPIVGDTYDHSEATNKGIYGVYSGRFLNDRLFIVAGIRQDKNSVGTESEDYDNPDANRAWTESDELSHVSEQYGISFEVINGVTLFALKSEGVNPNFEGLIDGYGNPIEAATAEAKEWGVKLNLFEGKVAATISSFKIERSGVPFSYWWAPAPAAGNFRPNDDIIYRMDDFDPTAEGKEENRYLQGAMEEWQAAVDSGAVYEKNGNKYLNASTTEGAAYLDAVFAELKDEFNQPLDQRTDMDPWAGWLYNGFPEDDEVNIATEDWSSGGYHQTIADSSEGWEASVMLTPTDSLQMVLNYSHVTRQVDNPGNFASYPYADGNVDRWAVWYFPNSAWGLTGVNDEIMYPGGENGEPNYDTSSWSGVGYGAGESLDDTPEHVVSAWGTYRFLEGPLQGLQLGLGGTWESEREYASSFSTSGSKKLNETGVKISAKTDPRLTINAMAKYSKSFEHYDLFTQLNVDNLLDDTDQYGFIYAPGLSYRLQVGVTF
ncbi:MAG: TonB-dependent receptor [Puniceicoccaceae bacterium 5H]|nr:MAG: TonB-dependent receptor [Puniceicoccaceae bacterium 5H]